MLIQILATLFVLFAVSRVLLRHRDGSIGLFGTMAWSLLWFGILVVFWWPNLTEGVARAIGVGRGADAIVYLSIIALFYGMFRIYIKLEYVEHELTSLVRNLALRNEGQEPNDPLPDGK